MLLKTNKHKMRYFFFIPLLKNLCIFLLLGVSFQSLFAQKNIDSLLSHANSSKSDTLIIKELSQTANAIKFEKPHDALKLSNEAIEISKRLNFTKGLIYNYQLLGDIHYQTQQYER